MVGQLDFVFDLLVSNTLALLWQHISSTANG